MQSVELYNPTSADLHLTPFANVNSLTDNFNPLNYQLTMDDFIALTQADGQLLYTLDPSTTGSLFWVLHRLAQYITKAASYDLHSDPTIPFASKGYIPKIYFDRINMRRPDILTIQDHHSINPLCGYTTRENLSAWYIDFQTIGRLAIQWIQAARQQTLQLGHGTGWNWGAGQSTHLEYPVRCLITSGTMEDEESNIFSDVACKGSDGEISDWEEGNLNKESSSIGDKRIILHPSKSAYAVRYPDFNPFAGEALVDNGYVDNAIDYLHTTFVPYDEIMEG